MLKQKNNYRQLALLQQCASAVAEQEMLKVRHNYVKIDCN